MTAGESARGAQRWFAENDRAGSSAYVHRFRLLADDGADLDGEARLVDTLVTRGSRILDAGCGPGRVGAALHRRGHEVVGVDADETLLCAAIEDHPGPRWLVGDLATLELPGPSFDAVVLAGNVMVYLAPGTEAEVLQRLAALLRPSGVLVTGFATDRAYRVGDLDRDATTAGLELEHRFATWDLLPWRDDAGWAVSIFRRPAA